MKHSVTLLSVGVKVRFSSAKVFCSKKMNKL